MNTPLEFYTAQAKSLLSDIPWVAALQSEALTSLENTGFPVRQDEDWKYTKLDGLWQESFSLPQTAPVYVTETLPEGVIVMPLAEAFVHHADKLKDHISIATHGFHALNTACMQQGLFVYVPAHIKIETPVRLTHPAVAGEVKHIRHIIIAEAGSYLTLIEDYTGKDEQYLTNTVTDIILQESAQLIHYKVQRESLSAYHIGLINVKQAEKSHFESHSFSLGGKLVRSDVDIQLQGSKASCLMNGVYIPGHDQHIDHHTSVKHNVPDCKSTQDYKGILMGHARAVFNGKVLVEKNAQHTDANQHNKNLLLSKGAEIDTKPQLEIFADDVICTHGATVGQLDEDALFYLAARGIDREQAQTFLVHAFVSKNLQIIPDTDMAEWISALINQQLELQS